MTKKIKIMLVEDNPEYRDVIEFALEEDETIELVSQFGVAERALQNFREQTARTAPDVILLDISLPGISGLEALPYFTQAAPDCSIIVLTQSDNEADVLKAISLGARGYLLKSGTVPQIKNGIRTVANGGSTLDPKIARFILDTLKTQMPQPAADNPLSDRELQTLRLLSQGKVRKEIAATLSISPFTVDTHIRHIYEKLKVENAPAAVAKAYQNGIFPTSN